VPPPEPLPAGGAPRPSIALATTEAAAGLDPDEAILVAEMVSLGANVTTAPWRDPKVDWSTFDLVVVKSTWDYMDHVAEFHAWVRRVASTTRLRNQPAMIEWNLDKHYLLDLADAGVPTIATTWLEPGDPVRLPDVAEAVVVKPAIGAGSRDTAIYRLTVEGHEALAERHIARLLGAGRSAMVQPFLASVAELGEWPMVMIDGRFSHTASKRVPVPEASVTDALFVPEILDTAIATTAMVEVADATMAAVTARFGVPLHGRVDLVMGDDGDPVVLEVELIEPSLFLPQAPSAVNRMAAAFVRAASP
jgi:hypothetical protein